MSREGFGGYVNRLPIMTDCYFFKSAIASAAVIVPVSVNIYFDIDIDFVIIIIFVFDLYCNSCGFIVTVTAAESSFAYRWRMLASSGGSNFGGTWFSSPAPALSTSTVVTTARG